MGQRISPRRCPRIPSPPHWALHWLTRPLSTQVISHCEVPGWRNPFTSLLSITRGLKIFCFGEKALFLLSANRHSRWTGILLGKYQEGTKEKQYRCSGQDFLFTWGKPNHGFCATYVNVLSFLSRWVRCWQLHPEIRESEDIEWEDFFH